MAISPQPTVPNRLTQTQAEFSANSSNIVDWMGDFAEELNSVSSTYLLGVSGTSTTSNAIGTGAKTFTTQTGLGFLTGQTLRIANDGTNYMTGDVTSYTSGTGALVMNITSAEGSGTLASWTISLAAVGASSAADVTFTPAGNIAATDVQSAIEELDTEKLSASAGAVTGTNLEDIITGGSVGGSGTTPVITYDANGRITAVSSTGVWTYMSKQNATSGSAITFTGIPSWATEIDMTGVAVSTDGTSNTGCQIGDAGGLENTGYSGMCARIGNSGGINSVNSTRFFVNNNTIAALSFDFNIKLSKHDGNTWSMVGSCGDAAGSNGSFCSLIGTKTLSDTLTQIAFLSSSDNFDGSGTIVVRYR